MNTMTNELSLKTVVCAAVAVALTAVGSWGFVTAKVPSVQATVTESLGDVVITASRQV